jgi:hypothetical protein
LEEATAQAEKHVARSETLAALVVEARSLLEVERAAEAERVRVAAEAAAAAAAVKAAEAAAAAAVEAAAAAKRERLAALALELQQLQEELHPPPVDETLCVLCQDAPKDHIITPCGHQCVCGACVEKLKLEDSPTCPICREPIASTFKVFVVEDSEDF